MLKAFALALLPTLLIAQEPAKDDLKDLQDLLKQPVISSASKRLQRLKEAPVDATVLTGEDLRRLGYHTLSEALDGALGFRVVRDRAYDDLAVRGLQLVGDLNSRVLILLDGHPLNSPDSLAGSMIGQDFGIPLERVERIELIRGPASALYGTTAFIGMVNVITRAPAKGGEGALEAQARGGFGGWARAGWAIAGSTWDVTASGWQRTGTAMNFPELGVGTLPAELDREERQSAYLRGTGDHWSLSGYVMSNLRRFASAPFSTVIGDPKTHYVDSLAFGEFKAEPRFGSVDTLVRLFGERYVFAGTYAYDGVRDPSTTQSTEERDPSVGYGVELQARTPMGTLGTLTVGSEQKWGQLKTHILSEGSWIDTQIGSQSGNTYLQTDWAFQNGTSLTLGLQHATQRITRADQAFAGQVTAFPLASTKELTPRFALILNPTATDILKLLYGGGYRYPTYTERYYDDSQAYRANPDLQPERIKTAQAIWVHIWGGGIQSQLGLSDSRWTGLIEYQDDGTGMLQARNQPGTIRGQSAELELMGRQPGWIWMVQAGTYQWKRADGSDFPDNARLQAGARVTRIWGPWSLTGEARHVGRREDTVLGVVAPAATTLRTALRWEGRRAWATVSMEDLGNARRVDLVPLDYDPIQRMAADGRTWRITTGWRF